MLAVDINIICFYCAIYNPSAAAGVLVRIPTFEVPAVAINALPCTDAPPVTVKPSPHITPFPKLANCNATLHQTGG
ncbi:MAG: hypothetical protein CM15mV90_250 [uncultured marine virus]|nr:MAG: hypothetical protein CM15mV90_250 [uncultured marine virus]